MRTQFALLLVAFVLDATLIANHDILAGDNQPGNQIPNGVPTNGLGPANPLQMGNVPGVNGLTPQVQNMLMLRALRGYRGGNGGNNVRTGVQNPIMNGNFDGDMDQMMGGAAAPEAGNRSSIAEKRPRLRAQNEEKKKANKLAAEEKKAKIKAAKMAKAAKKKSPPADGQ